MAAGAFLHSLTAHSTHLLARATNNTCSSHVCQSVASSILKDIDVNVDPCSDFYQYTCGGWIKTHPIPPSDPSVGTFTDLRNANLDSLQQLLQGTYDDLLTGVDPNSGFLNETEKEQDRSNFNKIKTYYDACMDEVTVDHLGPTPMFPDIAQALKSLGYSPGVDDGRFSLEHAHALTDVLIELNSQGVGNLVSFDVGIDDKNPEKYAIFLNQPSLSLPSREYYKQPDLIAQYRNGLISVVTAVLGDVAGDSSRLRIEKLIENKLPVLGAVDIEAMVDRFIEFETQLANISLPIDELQDPLAVYNPMTVGELHQKYPIADWFRTLRHFVPNDASLPDNVIVTSPGYLKELTDWLVNSQTRPDGASIQAIREYFIIRIILSNIHSIDKKTRDLHRETIGKLVNGATEAPPRSRECVASTSGAFGQLLGRYFVMKSFGGEPQRKQVSEFIENLLSAWSGRLKQSDWLDIETRTRALNKIKKLTHQEAYSIISPDVRSSNSLQNYYSGIEIKEKDYYGNQKSVMMSEFKKEWSRVEEKIVIPAGILQAPFYHTDLPSYINYGGIGAVIGHEITHAFDNSGRLYDGDGRLNTWWTDATTSAFESRSQCFINQYNQFSIQGPDKTNYSVNGKMTLGENLADNGGLHTAYAAMKKTLTEDNLVVLPGLEKYTPEQLFFINFGRIWCNNMRPELSVQRVRTDVHSPNSVRVNGAVQNSAEFAQAFQCPQKPMNPSNKCQIW
ncbi:hypothetical protein G6F70_005648 [Rhizopus microsporus]|nr:hypothetical protein G6F71_002456 [Rhizopus microsporus]KAG1198617.1 hypothetical protein G6F70_005648 [Rhizopus microsporus]KAG1210451.1 hypothetical protein G6F69_005470 [Rhizopus microsporus]